MEVTCPACQAAFAVPSSGAPLPTAAKNMGSQVKYWIVDARVLLLREPPSYVKTLMEVPKSWELPPDGTLPEPAFEAVKKAIRKKFPQCPITPVKVRAADQQALKRTSGPIDFGNETCKTWFIGKTTSAA
jgi:hypothetical protein